MLLLQLIFLYFSISKQSWKDQEQTFQSEIQVLKKRISDLENQNAVLHQELEQVSAVQANLLCFCKLVFLKLSI